MSERLRIGELTINNYIDFLRVLIEPGVLNHFQVSGMRDLAKPPKRGQDGRDIIGPFRAEQDDMSDHGFALLVDARISHFLSGD